VPEQIVMTPIARVGLAGYFVLPQKDA